MTQTLTFTSPRRGDVPGRRSRTGRRERFGVSKPTPFRRSLADSLWQTRAQPPQGTIAGGGDCCSASGKKRSLGGRQTNVQLVQSVWRGDATNPKRALFVFTRICANNNFAYAAFSTGSERTSYYLLHCGWGQLQECGMRAIGTLILSVLVCCLFAFSPARAQIGIGISIDVAPPPLPVFDQPPIPAPGYIWTPGYWAWDDDNGYYWVPGTWVLPPEPELVWTPGYWGWHGGAYAFHEGYWGPEVGFYGGVSYCFGYTGEGYEGGYWRGGAFFYNRTVNNISNAQISNVYNKTVVVNNVTNVSYNGGAGGTTAQATPQQNAAAHQQHVAPTAQQTQHMEMAAKDPALSLNNNQGHPTVAATTHAAQMSGAGVVAAHPGTPVAAIAPQGHNVGHAGGAET